MPLTPQYFLICDHPHIEDIDPDPDETYLEIVRRQEEHIVPENDDESALRWVENHAREEVHCLVSGERGHPQPLRLVKVLRQW